MGEFITVKVWAAQDLVEELAAPHWYVDRKGETPPGKKEFYKQPIYNYHQVRFSSLPYRAMLCG